MEKYSGSDIVNIGAGEDVAIKELAKIVQQVTGHNGPIIWDHSKPDGTPRKLLDVSRKHQFGWQHRISLEEGIARVYSEIDKENW